MLSWSPGIIRTETPIRSTREAVVGAGETVLRGLFVGGADKLTAKGLRGLRQPQPFPFHRFHHLARGADRLHGIPDRHANRSGSVLIGRRHDAADQLAADKGPDAVMDEDDSVVVAHLHQGVCDRILPLRSAREDRP